MSDYLFERIKKETQKKTMLQGAYLIVKGLINGKGENNELFNSLDELFEIPKQKKKAQQTQQELVDDFCKYIGA